VRRTTAALAALPLLTAVLTPAAPAAAETSPSEARVVPIQVTGDPSERFNLVILGDGYTEEEMPLFREQLDQHLNVQWSIEPFRTYRNYLNVYAVQTPSAESGVDCDPAREDQERDTALDMGFFNGCDPEAPERLLTVDEEAAEAAADLVPGVSADTLTATVTDPAAPGGDSQTLVWKVDNTAPTAPRELSEPAATAGEDHHIHLNAFSMRLSPRDDGEGHVVGEFRVDGDGWHHYYGWPDDPGAPFRFTPDGTNVDDLVYGSLGSGGLSTAVFEVDGHEPGWGTHTVEHRAIDAAGNTGSPDSFRATVVPAAAPECTETVTGTVRGGLDVGSGVVCLDGAVVSGGVNVAAGASLVVDGGSLRGGLNADGAHTVRLTGTEVRGAVRVSGTTSEVMVLGSELTGSLALHGNTQVPSPTWTGDPGGYGPVLAGNSVRGSLSCTGNSPAIADFGAANDVTGSAAGQCAHL
jgi:hypothetical protein